MSGLPSPDRRFVLEPSEFRLLEGLHLNPRKSFAGRVRGERLTRKKGLSIEFADFREYVEGDDLRHLDWNALARLDATVVKTYQDEEDLAVHVLLDVSKSMGFGTPSKFETALRLACAVGFLGLAGHDAVFPGALGARVAPLPALRGRAAMARFAQWLNERAPEGEGTLSDSVRTFARSKARPGVAFLVTDGLDPDLPAALAALTGRGHEIAMLHVLSREELDPDMEGDLRLRDSEGEGLVEGTASGSTLKAYRERLDAHCRALELACTRPGGRYLRVLSGDRLEALLRGPFRREGWVAS